MRETHDLKYESCAKDIISYNVTIVSYETINQL